VKIRNVRLIRFAAVMIATAFRLLFRTVRLDFAQAHPRTSPYEDTGDLRYLHCLWHDGIAGFVFSRPAVRAAALVSRHADGSLLAEGMHSIGVTPIRGSSRRGGAAALRQMLDAAADYHIAIATDGPTGPRHVVKEGIVFLASQSGRAIIPAAFEARRAWRPWGRWTDLIIPLPGTRTYMRAGAPIHVPPGLSREELEPYRLQVQHLMDELNREVRRLAGRSDAADFEPASRPRAEARRRAA
jgi:lysophospholipid acyltransferase (LPLAT)-like uncharacterized protein